jgi:hypothetical protein
MLRYTIKYYALIFPKESNIIDVAVDNSQLLFKLSTFSRYQLKKSHKSNKFDEIIYAYYNRSSIKSSTPDLDRQTRLISHFNQRIFHELPKYFYLSDSIDPNEEQAFLAEFILNTKWLLNKSFTCSSVLYYVHDLVFYRKLFFSEIDSDESTATTTTTTAEDAQLSPIKQKFLKFERIVYKLLFSLNQDQNQIQIYLKLAGLDSLLTNLNYLSRRTAHDLPKLVPLNLNYLKVKEHLESKMSPLDEFNVKELIFYSKVVFIDKRTFLTLSDGPFNLIKVWRIDETQTGGHLLDTIRTIKFNKSPKDLRLINQRMAVVLLERNLHLIDLNKCEHVFDLNSTMNPSFALFELHDANHVVLLARNRLTVHLMKLPLTSSKCAETTTTSANETSVGGEEAKLLNTSTTKTASKDDMYSFKVGEDRYLKSLKVSRNGKIMVCGDEVQKPFPLLVWNLEQRKLVYDLRQPNHEIITSIQSISSSGKYFVSACQVR